MGIFSKSGSRGHIDIDWNPLPLPKNTEDFRSRVTLESAMFEREPNRKYDYSSFLYLDNLPECKGITIEINCLWSKHTLLYRQISTCNCILD